MGYEELAITERDDEGAARVKRRVAEGLLRLRRGLDAHFALPCDDGGPAARSRVRLATWNIRELATRNKYGRRLDDAYWFIAEVIRRFDVVALQEVRGDLEALRRVLELLGEGWDYLATDVTEGRPGNGERMVFVYDTRRVSFGGVAGELTLSGGRVLRDARGVELSSDAPLELRFDRRRELRLPDGVASRAGESGLETAEGVYVDLPEGATLRLPPGTRLRLPAGTPVRRRGARLSLGRRVRHVLERGQRLQIPRPARADGVLQFARTPYYVSFRAGWLNVILCTVHIYYGEAGARSAGMERRVAEIERLTELLGQRARDEGDSDSRSLFVLLGDFNIVGKGHRTMKALERRGFVIPEGIREIPAGTNVDRTKFYDQIAYHRRPDRLPRVRPLRAGVFDFFEHVYRAGDEPALRAEMRAEQAASSSRARPWPYATWRTYQMSDHLPMWVELETDFAAEALRGMLRGTNPD